MKAAQVILITFLFFCLINWCRQSYFDEALPRVLPFLGGRDISIYDLAGIFCIGWMIYRIIRLRNRDK
ncbi:MAG: hypothetical protein GY845_08695 [Planctomycetes bacterium]|nr:hypothetical protein [Planctomycetota bacterium]